MYVLRISFALALTTWLCGSAVARAQDQFGSALPPAHIAVVEGTATLNREDQTQVATPGMPYLPGDRLRTERGRVEILFADGSALDVDEISSVDLQDAGLLRMTDGRVLLTVARANGPAAMRYQIETPSGSVALDAPGEYRVTFVNGSAGPTTELSVLRGSGALTSEFGSQPLRAGERSVARVNGAPSFPQPFNAAYADALDRWASTQRTARFGSAASAQYLPPDLQMYGGTLDRNGSWAYDAAYGNVWYPSVPPGWRPYYDGYWDPLPSLGWTWIGASVWSWPTHHYGRWGFAHSRWFWMPGRQWAPAWVHWGAAPGYVGWCPLGFDNRPVFSLSASYTNHRTDGWVVLPRPYFGARSNIHRYAISPRLLPANTPFVEHAAAPIAPSRAVPRGSAGITSASRGYAVPRTATPGPAFPTPQQVPMFAAPRTTRDGAMRRPSEGAIRRPSLGAATPPSVNAPRAAETPNPVPRAATPRYAPRVERTSPAVAAPAPPPPQSRGLATPRSSAPAAPPPSSGHAGGHAQGSAGSPRGNAGGVSGGSTQGSHDAHSRRPR